MLRIQRSLNTELGGIRIETVGTSKNLWLKKCGAKGPTFFDFFSFKSSPNWGHEWNFTSLSKVSIGPATYLADRFILLGSWEYIFL